MTAERGIYIGPMPSPVATTTVSYVYDPLHRVKMSLPISSVLGTAHYQIKTVDNGESVGFRIDNRTDPESGTHIAGISPGGFAGNMHDGSVEE
ncbi:MAG TPA: hypothetical protein VJL59_18640 [Anaerolineales bacterium]|nr:hypothetical protein [Anaerolineales bacterium]